MEAEPEKCTSLSQGFWSGSVNDGAMDQDEDASRGESNAVENKNTEEGAESDGENVEEEDPGEDHEFEIIDQVESEEEDEKNNSATGEHDEGSKGRLHTNKGDQAGSSDSSSEFDDVDDTEIHAMLEQGIDRNSIRKREEPTEGKPIIKLKTVLKEFENDPFDILPEGWIFVTHNCGMPIYLHKESRVCTMARPYSLGSASARSGPSVSQESGQRDRPALIAEESSCQVGICESTQPKEVLHTGINEFSMINRESVELKNIAVEKSENRMNEATEDKSIENREDENVDNREDKNAIASSNETLKANAAAIKIKCAEERAKESLLDSKAVQSYCSKLFQFKVIEVKKYSSWKERRKHLERKYKKNRPELPFFHLFPFTLNVYCSTEFVLNPTGKSYLCILHEYMQRTLKIQPVYVFKELENSKTPYGATVTINNIEYGTGYASSKKIAKQEAAKETLKILMPDLFNKMSDHEIKHSISDLSFFDNVKVTDTRVLELGNKVGQPSPFEVLQECLRRNFGMGNTQCDISTKPLKNQKCEYFIQVGKHTAAVVAKNKRDGKQQAAQAILAKLHPHVPSWGSLLRLYGTTVEKTIQKPEQLHHFKGHAPNHSVLASLRDEMRKLHKQK
ncbi:microprocessor complex subunit DGCR8, partial [Elysia marginata]